MRASSVPGVATLIGDDAPIDWPHGFSVSRAVIAAGDNHLVPPRTTAQVILVQTGAVDCRCDGEELALGTGDTFTVPHGYDVVIAAPGGATVFLVTGDPPVLVAA